MHVNIEYKNKEYTLSYDRKTAKDMSAFLAETEDADIYERAEAIVGFALIKAHPELTEDERKEIAEYVCENYCVVSEPKDGEESEVNADETGLLAVLTEMIDDTIPKGFTGKASKEFKVVR